jgi:GAF domain-containing protein
MSKQHDREREVIASLSTALHSASTRSEVMSVILDQLFYHLKPDGALIVMRDPKTNAMLIELERGVLKDGTGIHLPPGVGVSGYVITTGMPYLNNDAKSDPRFMRPEIAGYLKAVACVPLIDEGKTIGALWIGRQSDITEEEVQLLMLMSEIITPFIHRVAQEEFKER